MNIIERLFNFIVGTFFALWPQTKPKKEKLRNTRIVAHRGVHENSLAIENTLPAFQFCKEYRLWGTELDVRLTKDLVPIIHHDPGLGRLFGRKGLSICEMSFAQLRSSAPEIPTLAEVVSAVSPDVHLMIEIKENYLDRPEAVAAVLKPLHHLKPESDYHLISLNPDWLSAFANIPLQAKMDVIWLDPNSIMKKNYDLGHGAISGHFLFFTSSIISSLKAHHRKIGVGFLDSRNSLYREIHRGADWIFTNHPLRIQKFSQE